MLRTELIRPLSDLLRDHAARIPDKVAFTDHRRTVTYADLERRTRRLGGHLADLGLQPGDRALIHLGNGVEIVESYLAVLRAGGVAVPFNPHAADAELVHAADDSGARVVVTDPAHLDQVRTLLPGRPHLRVVLTGASPAPAPPRGGGLPVSYDDLVGRDPARPARDDQSLDEAAFMLYTSGTTGKPKGVLSTQRACLWSVAACYAPVLGLSEQDTVLWPLPLHHSLAHVLCVVGVTATGASARLLDGFSADEVLSALEEDTYTFMAGVPTMYHHLLDAARSRPAPSGATTLTRCLTAGSNCPAPLRAEFETVFGIPLLDGYGSTETCGLITVNWPHGTRVPGSCGLPVPGVTVRLVDPDTAEDVPPGAEGEVWVNGPSLMLGYHNQPEATAQAMPGGWYRTGDLARRDPFGYLTITGRVKELIIRGSENIHPGEVEQVLLKVPGVFDAAVVGTPHDALGEVPIAFVVPSGDGFDPARLYDACREQLSGFKVPEAVYEIDHIPRTGSGKITRHVLRERPARLRAASGGQYESLLRMDWAPLPSVRTSGLRAAPRWAVVGPDPFGVTAALTTAGLDVTSCPEAPPSAVAGGDPLPDVVVLCLPDGLAPGGRLAGAAHTAADRLRDTLRTWAGDDRLTSCRLVVLTRNAVAVGEEGVRDLLHAPVWGLIRSMQAAHPHRFTLVDIDRHESSPAALPSAVATGEPQLAVRAGSTLTPRLTRVSASVDTGPALSVDPRRTVVVTGAADPVGGALTRHLVAAYGARHLLLIGPRGRGDGAVARLERELTALGARVAVAACDITDRKDLAGTLGRLKRPVGAVVHCDGGHPGAPGATAPGATEPGGPGEGDAFRAAVGGAVNLHQLTKDGGIRAFVMLSTAAGTLGLPGSHERAAAAAFLDALAHHRRDRGLPALSVSAGTPTADPTADPTPGTPTAAGRVRDLPQQELTAMFDVAGAAGITQAVITRIDGAVLHERTAPADVPPLLRGLIEVRAPLTAPDGHRLTELRRRLTARSPQERDAFLLDLVRTEVAAVLALTDTGRVAPRRTFRELGLTSAHAVELRRRLTTATGLRLAAPVAFDHPTPTALARHLRAELLGERPAVPPARSAPAPRDEPIAVVGMACRFPGGITSPEDLWRIVETGTDAVSAFPTDRNWDLDVLAAGASHTRHGGFLYDAADFDAGFFGISPREALAMDPQQRLLLEVSWEALERAGIDPAALRGTDGGVFAGVMYHDYGTDLPTAPEGTEGYWTTGTAGSVASGRIAFTLGLEGPAVTVDTACSSSLVALHWAARSLRQGECSLALAGGVTVMSTPATFIEFSRQGGLAADGRCKAFSDSADGTGWAEGAGLVVLERLSDARRNGHRVLALLRGSALNQDGASNGLTAPNGPSQQRVIAQALADAGLSAGDVDMVEAHGTGTTLGDPIEAQALIDAYGRDRPEGRPLWLGSVKSNIGHTQAAAGIAGVIKTVMALRHRVLPRTLHITTPSTHVDWGAGGVELLTAPREWAGGGRPRRAGVSGFGISGTNAHVILEEARVPEAGESADRTGGVPPVVPSVVPSVVPWVVSGRTAAALDAQLARLTALEAPPLDVALSLATTRTALEHRAVLAGGAEIARGTAQDRKLAVLFSGQGAQRLGMGRELYERFPAFADAFDAALAELEPGLREVMWGHDADTLNETRHTQPALFAVEVGLYRLAESLGVRPSFVAGHSVGEIAAAHVAGVFTLADACRLVSARARLMQELPRGGAMSALEATEDEVAPHLTDLVSIAAVNGPRALVVAGDEAGVRALVDRFAGRKTRRLLVGRAFHSPLMNPMLEEFRAAVADVPAGEPRIPVVSNLTGLLVRPGEMASPDYWVRHARETVRFRDGVRTLGDHGVSAFLELGPDGVLSALVPAALDRLPGAAPDPGAAPGAAPGAHAAPEPGALPGSGGTPAPEDVLAVPLLRRDRPEEVAAVTALARLHVAGTAVDWAPLYEGTGARRVDLPTYAFRRSRYWPEPAPGGTGPVDTEFWDLVEGGDLAAALDLAPDTAAAVAPALSLWRSRRRDRSVLDGWRYRESWTRLDLPPGEAPGGWLVVVPPGKRDTWTSAVVAALNGTVLEAAEPDRGALAEQLRGFTGTGVVSLLGADRHVPPTGSTHDDVPLGLSATLALVQALGDADITAPLWVVTRGAVSTGGDDPVTDPAQTAVWGLGRVVALEHPRRWGGLVDLPDTVDGPRLRAALANPLGEDQLAVRGGGVLGRRLVRAPRTARSGSWTPSGPVLITGGTGGLGAQVARALAARGAGHIVLAGRRGPNAPGAEDLVAQLAEHGTQVTVRACDVSDREAVRDLLAGIPGLAAVVHAAGIDTGDAPVASLTPENMRTLLAAKLASARHLHELTGDLEAFVLFSSGAAAWGSGGRPAYAAANAYLDGLARLRRSQGRAATSLQWGTWAGAGMAADPATAERLRRHGMLPMDPRLALTALSEAVADGETVLAVTHTDWKRFAPGFTAARPSPLLSEIPEHTRALAAPDEDGEAPDLAARLGGLPDEERAAAVLDLVRTQAAAVLGHPGGESIDVDTVFRDQGFDSLTAVEMRNRIKTATGLPVPSGLVFDHPTPRAVAEHLLTRIAAPTRSVLTELTRLEAALPSASATDRGAVQERLDKLLASLRGQAAPRSFEDDVNAASVEDLLTIIDDELLDLP
ncbi:type I polyketide synthase [Streptomyces pacificus]|uniref:SDR family NAD(P)-dependent oxidoreductase n=1 Tax=Streptomyces pacificus TaxID=2705029 RepID=A0A6A0B2E6_9ACTN|nr:type I polyketide synthase [Streptomyces pacificus]GFH39489.1 SDR family NAD(P)-dependent oxidoreductase [Streptomyces pacificus]